MVARKMLIALALVVPSALALVAAPAAAQDGSVQLNCSGGPAQIQPLGPPGTWDCTATVRFPSQGVGDPVNFFTLTLTESEAPGWANVIISPGSITGQWDNANPGSQTLNFEVTVALQANAPAFEPTKVSITGSVDSTNQQFSVAPDQITVTAGYFNLYNVRVDKKIGQGGPQDSVDYPIQVDNFSNGQTRFEFELLNPDSIPSGFNPVVPEPLILESAASGGENTQDSVTFSVYTPFQNGYVNELGSIQLRVKSFYAPDTSITGATSQISTLTQARGFYVPGPATGLVALGLLGAALGLAKVQRLDD